MNNSTKIDIMFWLFIAIYIISFVFLIHYSHFKSDTKYFIGAISFISGMFAGVIAFFYDDVVNFFRN